MASSSRRPTADRLTHVVIDTNVLVHDWLLKSAAGRTVLGRASEMELVLCVPEVVLREAHRAFQRGLKRADGELRAAAKERLRYASAAPHEHLASLLGVTDAKAAADGYRDALEDRLRDANARILPIPSVPHGQVLDRALAGRRPFDEDGRSGYRDVLIWHSALALVQEGVPVVLVSRDGDFTDRAGTLLAELQQEVERAVAPGQGSLVARPDLNAVIEHELGREAHLAHQFNDRLERELKFFRRVREQIDHAWIDSWPDLDVDGDIDFDWDGQEVDLVNDVFDDFEAVGAAEASNGATFLQIDAHADVQIRFDIPAPGAISSSGAVYDDVTLLDDYGRGEYIDVVPAALRVQALYRPGDPGLSNVDLVRVQEDWSWVTQGRRLGGTPEQRR